LFRPYIKVIATFKECQDGTQRFQSCCKARSKFFVLITLLKEFSSYSDSSCALAGQTGGAIRLSLIFLFLFPSREKENRSECMTEIFFVLLA